MRHYQRGIGTSIILIIFLIAGVAIASGGFVFFDKQQKLKAVNSFEDCAKYYPVMESYPEQCSTPDGKHFVRQQSKDASGSGSIPSNEPFSEDSVKANPPNGSWKTFKNQKFSIEYPENWFVNVFENDEGIELSNLKDSINQIKGGSEYFTRINVVFYTGPTPASFNYTNGQTGNPTVHSFSNGVYKGIRGFGTSTAGIEEVIYLTNPKGGFISITLTPPDQSNDYSEKVFDRLISSFRFL